ncbi:ATP-binding protein [Noviherbaspirillum sp. CPCC 100848]|uniref:histidine kinase n=1 Tax=Noviherbaspirillum album TaxID=3080276 RepID=A0ABU6J332_9BURK|nr:ATP-binding protein [Noviherbaspirillum sp. CPCC 100848]MEC4717945.1 ATP-binding protein [Noviherbaspirillum sp. CPCC 100848]
MDTANTDLPQVDLSICDREAIRIPGSIQPHGFLIAMDGIDGRIVQVSDNISELTGKNPADVVGLALADALGAECEMQVRTGLQEQVLSAQPAYLGTLEPMDGLYVDVLAHAHDGLIILELEKVGRRAQADFRLLYPLISNFLTKLGDTATVSAMSVLAANEIKRVTGFGRVLVYRFDEDGHGHVLAEALDPGYHSYMNQRFPASDVPRQARDLYLANRIRLIVDADYLPSRLYPESNPRSGQPTDLSFASLRSVSPVHLQYMRNMGTLASMSISIVVKGRLWGLISCHNADPCFVPFEVRAACEQLTQILALRVESREDGDEYNARLDLRHLVVSMLAGLTQGPDLVDNMKSIAPQLLRFASASGAALSFESRLVCMGDTPPEAKVRELIEWLSANAHDDLYHTNALSTVFPGGADIKRNASGILALPISRIHNHYLIWFRPEVIQTVDWAGNPHLKHDSGAPARQLTPRMSFDIWRETVHGTSIAWRSSEIEIAMEFRTALLGIVLERAEQMAELAEELGRANKELEAFSYSVSHDLRAPLRHIVGFSDLLLEFEGADAPERRIRFLKNIKDSARFAGKLVDDLLSFSQMGRASLRPCEINMNDMFNAAREKLQLETGARQIEWRIDALPVVEADPNFLQLAVYNLLSNAVKYTRLREKATIHVSGESNEAEHVFHVQDNGVGFNMEYVHKLFGVFQRLHRMEDFQGTGIGLANVRRIVERHGGRVWAESVVDQGARFSFALPRRIVLE